MNATRRKNQYRKMSMIPKHIVGALLTTILVSSTIYAFAPNPSYPDTTGYLVYAGESAKAKLETNMANEDAPLPIVTQKEEKKEPVAKKQAVTKTPQKVEYQGQDYVITAYDLSVDSTGKYPSNPAYGITASGFNLKGHSLSSARAIAVDPNYIPLGSKVQISFSDPQYQHLNGVYTAVDTGGGIRGHHIDLFFGDFGSVHASKEALRFGRQHAKVKIL